MTEVRVFEVAFGGVPRFIHSLADWLASQDREVTVMGATFASVQSKHISKPSLGLNSKTIVTSQGDIKSIHPPYVIFMLSRLWLSLLWTVKLLLLHRRMPITLIHAQDTSYSALAAVVCGKLLGIPVIATAHGLRHETLEKVIGGPFKKILLKIEKLIESITLSHSDRIIVVNSLMKPYYKPRTIEKIHTFPIPIKLDEFAYSESNRQKIRDELGINKETLVLGYVGRFEPEKNLITLLTSFADFVKNNSEVVLVLVGSGSLEPELKVFVTRNKLERNVFFIGVREDVAKVLSSLDIFVLPSYTEGLSMALLEAMACSRAIICSDIPYNHELVTDRKEALLFDPYKPEELRLAVDLLCKDNSLRMMIGQNAKHRAIQYDEKKIFPMLLNFYEDLIQVVRN